MLDLLREMMTTSEDVARAAGVSRPPVSQILIGRGRFSAETIDRVPSVTAELGYQPPAAARALATGTSDVRIRRRHHDCRIQACTRHPTQHSPATCLPRLSHTCNVKGDASARKRADRMAQRSISTLVNDSDRFCDHRQSR